MAITLRADPEWIAWLDTLCEKLSKDSGFPKPDRTAAIDFALSRLAADRGMPAAPPRF